MLRYDLYGRGWSSDVPRGFHYDALAHFEQLRSLLDELGLSDRPLTLLAHSMGACIAMDFAVRRSVVQLVLLAPAGAMKAPFPGFRGACAPTGP